MASKKQGSVAKKALTPNLLQRREEAWRILEGKKKDIQFFVVSADTYPLFAPSRLSTGMQERPVARYPRILSILLSTIIHDNASCWNPETRRITFDKEWLRYCDVLGIFRSKISRDGIYKCFQLMSSMPTDSPTPLIAVEDYSFDSKGRYQNYVTLTQQYADAAAQSLREIPVSALRELRHGFLVLDLLVLAALYVPERGQLAMPFSVLRALLSGMQSLQSVPHRNEIINQLNDAQNMWDYSYNNGVLYATDTQADMNSLSFQQVTLQ